MAIVMLALSVIIYNIFGVEISMTLTMMFRMGYGSKVNMPIER